jgi:hypothetical protein
MLLTQTNLCACTVKDHTSKDSINRFVHKLLNRAQELLKKAPKEVYRMGSLGPPQVLLLGDDCSATTDPFDPAFESICSDSRGERSNVAIVRSASGAVADLTSIPSSFTVKDDRIPNTKFLGLWSPKNTSRSRSRYRPEMSRLCNFGTRPFQYARPDWCQFDIDVVPLKIWQTLLKLGHRLDVKLFCRQRQTD